MSAPAAIMRGVIAYACRATVPTPGAVVVQVHLVLEQQLPRAPRVHAYMPMGHGAAGMDRADAELQRLRRGMLVELHGAAVTITEARDAVWLRGCTSAQVLLSGQARITEVQAA